MVNKTYILAIFSFLLSFSAQAEAAVIHKNSGNPFEGINMLKMGPLDPREADELSASLPNDDAEQNEEE